jgi:hypothetical protein
MSNIFRDHFQRVTAQQGGQTAHGSHGASHHGAGRAPALIATAMPANGPVASEYRMMLVQLGEDLRRLSNIQSVEKKIETKRDMIAAYIPWVKGAMAAPKPVQDDIVTTMLVWSLDIANWPLALDLAAHVLRHHLALPERYTRTPGCLIAEQAAEAGLAPTPAITLGDLQSFADLTDVEDMPDQVRAKLQKAIGLAFKARVDAFDPEAESAPAGGKGALIAAALDAFTRALELDRSSGVKKAIEQLEREAKKITPAHDAPDPAQDPEPHP